ncbi:hypothetical protein [Streptomyces cucumeris]|uniref:hypothetical protein n=1 Tax=Streptomyces cucumeris TaxID=2962890 RepID=UPI0020C8AC0C|nr:hypothetical protein [Streptomyces sp. NEAU-Y11]MCP9209574.1 hypothetical protein [Streptomyces sp. NEAU-Y11]
MGWVQYGDIQTDDGDYGGDIQIGKATHVRFIHTGMPGRLVTVTAYPVAPERSIETQEGSVVHFHGFESDMNAVGIQSQIELMICGDIDDPGSTEEWSDYLYENLDTRPYSRGDDETKVKAAEVDALRWVERFDANRDIHWDGERF